MSNDDDLSAYVVATPPAQAGGWHVWSNRFDQIANQGLVGKWIDVTAAWVLPGGGPWHPHATGERTGAGIEGWDTAP